MRLPRAGIQREERTGLCTDSGHAPLCEGQGDEAESAIKPGKKRIMME